MDRLFSHGLPLRQRGVALAVALILLVVITLVGLAAVNGTIMQQKMSANFHDRQVAFQSTEAAMREAALAIQAATTAPPGSFFDCSSGSGNVCQSNPFTDSNVSSSYIITVSASSYDAGSTAAGQPQYIVQYLGNFPMPAPRVKQTSHSAYGEASAKQTADFYRITARSGDPATLGSRASVELQSVFRN